MRRLTMLVVALVILAGGVAAFAAHGSRLAPRAGALQAVEDALDGPRLDGKAGWRDVKVNRLNPTEIGA